MKSISFRLTLWYTFVVTVTVIACLIVGRYLMERYIVRGLDYMMDAEFQEVRSRVMALGTTTAQPYILEAIRYHAELDTALYYFQVNRDHEDILFRSANLGVHELSSELHRAEPVTVNHPQLGLMRAREFAIGDLDVHIAMSLANVELLFSNYKRMGLTITFVVLLLSIGVGFFLSRVALNPIRAIQNSARRITASNFNERINVPDTKDEVARMAHLLNEMLDRLQSAYQLVRRFTAEASHEFRTPLSVIRLQTERLMREETLTPQDRLECLQDQLESIERLNKLVDDLLLLAKADAGVMQIQFKRVSLKPYLDDFAEDATLLAEDKGVTFSVVGSTAVDGYFDPVWMRHVLLNLFSNALKFSEAGKHITLMIEVEADHLRFAMCDEGPGVAEDKLGLIFERFHRLESEHVIPGSGLGLAICKSIVSRHAGSIRASNRMPSGLRVEVEIPNREPATGTAI